MAHICEIDGCDKSMAAKGMCLMHYKRVKKHGDPHHVTKKTPPSRRTHGESWKEGKATPEYNAWASMKSRCYNSTAQNFMDYGGRGIKVCEKWRDSFEAFISDMGKRPSKRHSLDRVDYNGNYEPGNCRWATSHQQCNNKRNNRYFDLPFVGRVTLTEAARLWGKDVVLVRSRIKRGWSIQRALNE